MTKFQRRLQALGFASYDEYLRSELWTSFRERYHLSDLPQTCLVCNSARRICLHHTTYKRLGNELLTDVVPLCYIHHEAVHSWIKENAAKLEHTADAIATLRGDVISARYTKWKERQKAKRGTKQWKARNQYHLQCLRRGGRPRKMARRWLRRNGFPEPRESDWPINLQSDYVRRNPRLVPFLTRPLNEL
jgi:hypothetical protein